MKYVVIMQCFEPDKRVPYIDYINKIFESDTAAYEAIEKACKDEVETLQEGMQPNSFSYQPLGDEYDMVVLMWYNNNHDEEESCSDYRVVTGYKIIGIDTAAQ